MDDLAVEGVQKWLDATFSKMTAKFGKLTRERLPFVHCGCRYSKIGSGLRVDQYDYVSMLKPVKVDTNDADERQLDASELTILRSAIGGLMWTGLTRPDLLAELSNLQSVMNKACVKHLRAANSLVQRAKRDSEAAIHYRPLDSDSYRIVVIHDASAATSSKNYAQEGVLVVLMSDHLNVGENHIIADDNFARDKLSGFGQLLHMQSTKAKRISYSTSHGETLAALSGLECGTLVSTRLAEITFAKTKPTIAQLLAVQERGNAWFPLDSHTDCKDFYELSTGLRSMPQDKSQRLYILAHREARASGRLRWVVLTPTEAMTADALTKVMTSPVLMKFLTTGYIEFFNAGHPLELKRLPPNDDIDEDDLVAGDAILEKKKAWFAMIPALLASKKLFSEAVLASMATPAAAQPQHVELWGFYDWVLMAIAVLLCIASGSLSVMVDRSCCRRSTAPPSTCTTTSSTTTTAAASGAASSGDPPTMIPTTTSAAAACAPPPEATHSRPRDVWVRKGGHVYHLPSCVYAQGAKRFSPCGFCLSAGR